MRPAQVGFPQLVQDFFLRRLITQRGASPRTIEAYRDAFELLLGFAQRRTAKPASALCLADLDAPLVLDFLDHLETERGNAVRTRNARLAAIHSFMHYAAIRDPSSLPITARVLAIPAKRFDRPVLGYLSREQVAAILADPDAAAKVRLLAADVAYEDDATFAKFLASESQKWKEIIPTMNLSASN